MPIADTASAPPPLGRFFGHNPWFWDEENLNVVAGH